MYPFQLLAKLTKFGWFNTQNDRHVFRSITDDIGQFFQGSMEHCIIGIKVLAELVSLINQVILVSFGLKRNSNRFIGCFINFIDWFIYKLKPFH